MQVREEDGIVLTFERRPSTKKSRPPAADWRRHAKFSDWSSRPTSQKRDPSARSTVLFERFDYDKASPAGGRIKKARAVTVDLQPYSDDRIQVCPRKKY